MCCLLGGRKLQDFVEEGEKKVPEKILQTRYDFHHNKRFYKLGELWKMKDQQRAMELEMRQLEKENKKNQVSARGDNDSRHHSQHNVGQNRGSSMNITKVPSNMNLKNEYSQFTAGNKAKFGAGFANVGKASESKSRMVGGRTQASSRMDLNNFAQQRNTPRTSSLNVRVDLASPKTRNRPHVIGDPVGGNLFMTQPDLAHGNYRSNVISPAGERLSILQPPGERLIATAPKGALHPNRNFKTMQGHHQRAISMNTSQIGVGAAPEPLNALDIDREKNKIARFLSTKERCGLRFLEKEAKAEAKLREIENRTNDFEKRKKAERKITAQKLKEREEEVKEKRDKVE